MRDAFRPFSLFLFLIFFTPPAVLIYRARELSCYNVFCFMFPPHTHTQLLFIPPLRGPIDWKQNTRLARAKKEGNCVAHYVLLLFNFPWVLEACLDRHTRTVASAGLTPREGMARLAPTWPTAAWGGVGMVGWCRRGWGLGIYALFPLRGAWVFLVVLSAAAAASLHLRRRCYSLSVSSSPPSLG